MSEVKFPEVEVEVEGVNANAFAILGTVSRAMKKAGITDQDIKEYRDKATSGDYNNLLKVTVETVRVF